MSVAVLIPVLDRPQRVAPLLASLLATTAVVTAPRAVTGPIEADDLLAMPLFLCNDNDDAQIAAVRAEGWPPVVVPWPATRGDYARKMNYGMRLARANGDNWVFLGADDLQFGDGWLKAALACHTRTRACVIGTNDLGNSRVTAGDHSTHTLVHVDYLDCGTIDEQGVVLHEGYWHNFCNPPNAPIWMADLTFRNLGDVAVGDQVIGWERVSSGRYTAKQLGRAEVLDIRRRRAPLVKVTMASGRSLLCTPDHLWANGARSPSSRHGAEWITATPGRSLHHIVAPPEWKPVGFERGARRFGIRDRVVSVTEISRSREVVSMRTTTGNYVAWGYASKNCDNEFVETAKHRETWAHATDAVVEHLHPNWRKADQDDTYRRGQAHFEEDRQLHTTRRHLWAGLWR